MPRAATSRTELAAPPSHDGIDAGCGCAYPDWVGDGVVERSNRILARLRDTARKMPGACAALQALPMWRPVDVGDARVAVVHGDAQSLSAGASRRSRCVTRGASCGGAMVHAGAGRRVRQQPHLPAGVPLVR
jgi:hypothetical protein